MVFTGINYQLYRLNINNLSKISSWSFVNNISQMIWSPINNNLYVILRNGTFGYLDYYNNWALNPRFTFSPGVLRMSVSGEYSFIAVSSNMAF